MRPPGSLQAFWGPFLSGPGEPYVVFSNADFVGAADSGMRYFDQARDSRDQITQRYTGIGEVMGVLKLDRLFRLFGQQFRIKRVGLFTLDDALHSNLIFAGSPTENLTLRELPNPRDLAFEKVPDGPNQWNEVIVDKHPQAGGSTYYRPTPHQHPLEVDYAVVSLSHGLDNSRWTLVLAGTSTIGTQAAVDYVCDPASVQELVRRLNVTKPGALRPVRGLAPHQRSQRRSHRDTTPNRASEQLNH